MISDGRPALVLDLHNVCDLRTPQEMAELVAPLSGKYQIVLLSYVGATTTTRLEAQDYMKMMHNAAPHIHCYLCFQRGDHVAMSDKGDFIAQLGAPETHFVDDGEDHIEAGKSAGATTYLIPKDAVAGRQRVGEVIAALARA